MDLNDIAGSIVVPRNRALRLDDGDVRRVVVLAGNVWITQQGKLRDFVLQAGEEFVVERPADTVVSALGGSATIMLQRRADAEPRRVERN